MFISIFINVKNETLYRLLEVAADREELATNFHTIAFNCPYLAYGYDVGAVNADKFVFRQVLHDAHQVVVIDQILSLRFDPYIILEAFYVNDLIEHHLHHALVYFEKDMIWFWLRCAGF